MDHLPTPAVPVLHQRPVGGNPLMLEPYGPDAPRGGNRYPGQRPSADARTGNDRPPDSVPVLDERPEDLLDNIPVRAHGPHIAGGHGSYCYERAAGAMIDRGSTGVALRHGEE
jgi:hypothetical protein